MLVNGATGTHMEPDFGKYIRYWFPIFKGKSNFLTAFVWRLHRLHHWWNDYTIMCWPKHNLDMSLRLMWNSIKPCKMHELGSNIPNSLQCWLLTVIHNFAHWYIFTNHLINMVSGEYVLIPNFGISFWGWETKKIWHLLELGSLLYIAYTKFHSPRPVFYSPGQIFTRIGERASCP